MAAPTQTRHNTMRERIVDTLKPLVGVPIEERFHLWPKPVQRAFLYGKTHSPEYARDAARQAAAEHMADKVLAVLADTEPDGETLAGEDEVRVALTRALFPLIHPQVAHTANDIASWDHIEAAADTVLDVVRPILADRDRYRHNWHTTRDRMLAATDRLRAKVAQYHDRLTDTIVRAEVAEKERDAARTALEQATWRGDMFGTAFVYRDPETGQEKALDPARVLVRTHSRVPTDNLAMHDVANLLARLNNLAIENAIFIAERDRNRSAWRSARRRANRLHNTVQLVTTLRNYWRELGHGDGLHALQLTEALNPRALQPTEGGGDPT